MELSVADAGWKCYDARMECYEEICGAVMDAADEAGMSPRQALKLELGLEEIVVNIISYAYEDPGSVWVRTTAEGSCFRLEFADYGKPFDPLEKDRRPPEDTPLEEREPGGFGIFLVKKNFRAVEYKYEMFKAKMANHLTMIIDLQ